MLRSGWRVDGDEGIPGRGRFRRQAGGLAGPTLGGGREKTRRKSMGQGMKCPNIDQGTWNASMDLPLKYSKAEFNIIKVVFWSNLAGSNMKGWLRWARPEAGRPQIHKLISHWQIGELWWGSSEGSDGRTTGEGTEERGVRRRHRRMWGPLRHLQQEGSPLKAAELGTGLTASVEGWEQPAWDRVKSWPGTDWRPGSDQKHAVWWQHTPGQSRASRRGWGPSTSGWKGERGQGLRVLARDGQKHTFSVGSLTGLNLLGRNLARAIQKCNGIFPDPETLFLENYSIEILVCVYKDIYTNSNRKSAQQCF